MGKLKDITGQKFGMLTVVSWTGSRYWNCVCDCGNTTQARGNALRSGLRVSCGCFNKGWEHEPFSQEKFLEQAKAAHGDRYDYSSTVYKTSQQKVTIICKDHGPFEQIANTHVSGGGCNRCAIEESAKNRTMAQEEFLEKAEKVHGDKYNYSLVDYKNSKINVTIGCKACGNVFEQTPNSHLRGSGCDPCGYKVASEKLRHDTERFANAASNVHGNAFDYSEVDYVTTHTKVKIKCRTCNNSFMQQPMKHLQGRGCHFCQKTGFSTGKPGILYVLKAGDITKVGITNKTALSRAKFVSEASGHNFEVLRTYPFESGLDCLNVETKLLRKLRGVYKNPEAKFNGKSECFFEVNLKALYDDIEELTGEIE